MSSVQKTGGTRALESAYNPSGIVDAVIDRVVRLTGRKFRSRDLRPGDETFNLNQVYRRSSGRRERVEASEMDQRIRERHDDKSTSY